MIIKNKFCSGRRFKAFLLSILFVAYTFLGYVPHSFAAPDSTYVSELNEYFLNNPRWTPAEYMAEIQEINNKTLKPMQNHYNEWLNPHVYKHYNKTIVYGKPHGLFFNNSNGHMKNKDTKMQGEYQFLGYNEAGKSVTNDFYHDPSWSGTGKFTTYKEVSYKTIDGASNSWRDVNDDLFEYLMDAYFEDDDYVTPGQTPYNLRYILNVVFGGDINRFKDCVMIQIPPGVGSAASFRMEYGTSHWNTCTIRDVFFEYNFTGSLTTDKTTYTLKAGENDIVVTAALMAKLSGTSSNKYLKDVYFECLDYKKSVDISLTQDTYKYENIKITYNRSELQTGNNNFTINGYINVNSLYGDTKTVPVENENR